MLGGRHNASGIVLPIRDLDDVCRAEAAFGARTPLIVLVLLIMTISRSASPHFYTARLQYKLTSLS